MTYVDETISSSLRPDQRSSPSSTLSSQDTLELVLVLLVCTKEISDFTSTNSDITSWDISVSANVTAELAHESIAELSDLVVGFAFWIEIGSSFSTSNVHCSSRKFISTGPDLVVVVVVGCLTCERSRACKMMVNLRPVKAFLKICSKPKNFKMLKLTVG